MLKEKKLNFSKSVLVSIIIISILAIVAIFNCILLNNRITNMIFKNQKKPNKDKCLNDEEPHSI